MQAQWEVGMSSTMNGLKAFYGEPISVYTRAQAIENGELINVTEWASQREMMGGFNCPTAITRALWAKVEAPKNSHQDTRGRAHDVLWMAGCASRRHAAEFFDGSRIPFIVRLGNRNVKPVIVLDGDGVTIGLPEDF